MLFIPRQASYTQTPYAHCGHTCDFLVAFRLDLVENIESVLDEVGKTGKLFFDLAKPPSERNVEFAKQTSSPAFLAPLAVFSLAGLSLGALVRTGKLCAGAPSGALGCSACSDMARGVDSVDDILGKKSWLFSCWRGI